MYKIKKVVLLVVLAVFIQLNPVNAASTCDYNEQAELNNAVANIKATYEEAEELVADLGPGESGENDQIINEYFKLTFYNLSEDFYLKITNDYNNEVKYIRYNDVQSGVATYDWKETSEIVNFKITIYSSDSTSCPNEEYRIITLSTPRYNSYWNSAKCTGNESFYLCQKYITENEEIDDATFKEKLEAFENKKAEDVKEEEEKNKTLSDKISDFIGENKITIIMVATIVVVGGVVTMVIVIKKRRSRLI